MVSLATMISKGRAEGTGPDEAFRLFKRAASMGTAMRLRRSTALWKVSVRLSNNGFRMSRRLAPSWDLWVVPSVASAGAEWRKF